MARESSKFVNLEEKGKVLDHTIPYHTIGVGTYTVIDFGPTVTVILSRGRDITMSSYSDHSDASMTAWEI
jgi:hypothetical protein